MKITQFPVYLVAHDCSDDEQNEKPNETSMDWCSRDQIEADSGPFTGRWVITDQSISSKKNWTGVLDLKGYREGFSSLGFKSEYIPQQCSLIPEDALTYSIHNPSKLTLMDKCDLQDDTKIVLIIIGDSVMGQQRGALEEVMNNKRSKFKGRVLTRFIDISEWHGVNSKHL